MKRRNFTFALITDHPDTDINKVISIVRQFPKYAYILHNKDLNDDGSPKNDHYHFYVEFPSPRSFSSLGRDLGIPPEQIEKVWDKKGILEYLTHENQPDKYHYSKSEVITNMDLESEIKDTVDMVELYADFNRVKLGEIAPSQFLDKYKIYCATLAFYNKVRLVDTLSAFENSNIYKNQKRKIVEHTGMSMFHVPCSNLRSPPDKPIGGLEQKP